jgi:hypothetical protein
MAPLLLPDPDPDSPLMREEIFGPLLPVLGFSTFEEALAFIQDRDTPLSCYIFTRSRQTARALLHRLPFGGGCVNDVLVHAGSHALPFGGLGASGMGRYHGRAGFDLFSNPKSVIHGSPLLDLLCVIRLTVIGLSPYGGTLMRTIIEQRQRIITYMLQGLRVKSGRQATFPSRIHHTSLSVGTQENVWRA